MDALRKSGNAPLVAMLVIAALAIAFWVLLLGPDRKELSKLDGEVAAAQSSLALHRAEVVEAEEARRQFPADYQKLVVLGKAVPGDDETPSLLVQVSEISERSGVEFQELKLNGSGSGEASESPAASSGGEPVSATEASASLLPLGATVGSGGLAVMPYTLSFDGTFFKLADFIKGLDSMVKTPSEEVRVEGRLLTIDGFSLEAAPGGFPALTATFGVTTYITPPLANPGLDEAAGGGPGAVPAATKLGGAQ